MPEIKAKLTQLGFEPTNIPGEQFQRDVAAELKRWDRGGGQGRDQGRIAARQNWSARLYCLQAANASANACSPGVPFSMARMARRLLL